MKKSLSDIKNDVQKLTDEITDDLSTAANHIDQITDEYERVKNITENPQIIVDDIDNIFRKATRLQKPDITFLFFATALQIIRQIIQPKITTSAERLGDKEAAASAKRFEHKMTIKIAKQNNIPLEEIEKLANNRKHRLYKPSLEEILANPVPFDATNGASKYDALSGFGWLGHRGATPGHDPILGLLFGTANIATSTLTNWKMRSFHIYTGRIGNMTHEGEIFRSNASTFKVFGSCVQKLTHEGLEGKTIIGTSVAKEIVHLKSDIYSKRSLPLPIISTISPQLCGKLAKYGFDCANALAVGNQASYAIAINTIIAIAHSFFFDDLGVLSRKEFEVRTRKILVYSNLLASTSNIIATAVSRDVSNLDIGGLATTLYRLISDTVFITKVKEEFIKNELYNRITGDEYDFMKGEI